MIDAYLKPCRNCGTPKPNRVFGVRIGTDIDMYRIICHECDNASEIYEDEQAMIDAWNLRKEDVESERETDPPAS